MDTTPGDNQFHWKNKHARKFIFSKQLLNDNHDSQSRWVIRKALWIQHLESKVADNYRLVCMPLRDWVGAF